MPLQPGTRLGHYEVVASIGAGGMGEVYRARDSRLNRDVALKVLGVMPRHRGLSSRGNTTGATGKPIAPAFLEPRP